MQLATVDIPFILAVDCFDWAGYGALTTSASSAMVGLGYLELGDSAVWPLQARVSQSGTKKVRKFFK